MKLRTFCSYLLIFCFTLTVNNSCFATSFADNEDDYQLRKHTAEKIIQTLLEERLTYFMHSWYDSLGSKEAEEIIEEVTHHSLHNPDNFKRIRRKFFCEERLVNSAFMEVLERIKNKAHEYVLYKTNNRTYADDITEIIVEELLARDWSGGHYVHYLGQELRNKIDAKIEELEQPAKFYPSHECCICYIPFDATEHKQVFLQPCGHDICEECFEQYYERCALCRTPVEDWITNTETPGCVPHEEYSPYRSQ